MKCWIRVAIVLSVLWLIGVPTYHGLILRSGTTHAMAACKPKPNAPPSERLLDTRQCIQGRDQAEQLKRHFMEKDWLTIMLYPVAALWIAFVIGRWIRRGFT